jgi:beta-N-acetylhexosaminidase
VLEAKRALGLFARRTVPLDSIPAIVGSAAFQADAAAIAARSIVMVKDSGGVIYGLAGARPPVTLVTYAEEDNRTVGIALAAELRAQGFGVVLARLWPASGAASYDSAAAAIRRTPVTLFATADRPSAGRGSIGLPAALTGLIARTAHEGPAVLVSLGNPYLIGGLPEVGSYLIGWRANALTEQAVARALTGAVPITGRLPIALPPKYARGWGLQRHVP